jgi:hypothetical protein
MMKLDAKDWHKLRWPLLVLAIIVVLVAGLLYMAQLYSQQQAAALQTQQRLLHAAQQRYLASGSERALITAYLPQYQRLTASGFVGEERRMEWVEALRTQQLRHKLFTIKYNIGAQQEYKPTFAPDLGGFVLRRSVMKLDLDLLHEGDILHLIDSLARSTTPFMLRDCAISRLDSVAASSQPLLAKLHAQCELDWLTLHEPAAAGI